MYEEVRVVSLAHDMSTGPPLHSYETHLLVLLFISTKHQNMSKGIKVMERTRFWLQGRKLHNKESESCLSCT